MKTKLQILFAALLVLTAPGAFAATNEVSALLQKGLFEEEANRNLDAAIQAYQAVITQADKDHQFAATAVFRLAECFRKQGKTAEAAAQYQRILREFSDQADLVKLSRQQLGPDAADIGNSNATLIANISSRAETEAKTAVENYSNQLKALEDIGSADARALFVQAKYPNPILNTLVEEMIKTEQHLIILREDKSEENPEVKTAVKLLDSLHRQTESQFDLVYVDLTKKLETAKQNYTALLAQAVKESAPAPATAKATLENLEQELKEFESLPLEQRRVVIQQKHPTTLLSTLVDDLAKTEQHLATLRTSSGEQHPDVQSAEALLKTLQKQIDEQEAGILMDLREKRDGARQALNLPVEPATNPTKTDLPDPLSRTEEQDVRDIAAMIKDSPDLINVADSSGSTPLDAAVSRGQLKVAKYLLDNHADPDLLSRNGKAPLHLATENGNAEMVELLLTRADINTAAQGQTAQMNGLAGFTALHFAVRLGFKAIAETLLAHGAKVNAQDNLGNTPLHLVAGKGFRAVAEMLLAHGADVSIATHNGETPLFTAVRAGNPAIAELLVTNHADVNVKNQKGSTPLMEAASSGNRALVEFLIASHADINASDPNGETPLLLAATFDRLDAARALLEHGADANAEITSQESTERHWRPVHEAIAKNDTALLELLLQHGANPDAPVSYLPVSPFGNSSANSPTSYTSAPGATPLMMAISLNRKEAVEILLAHHASLTARDLSGRTALHWSVLHGGNLTALLLDHGAEIEARENEGYTPLHLAVYNSKPSVEILIAHHADINARANNGDTPLDLRFRQFPVSQPPPGSRETGDAIADLLRQHGGITELESGTVRITGKGKNALTVVFRRDTNSYNHFTLFETIANTYTPEDKSSVAMDYAPEGLRFPDFSHVKIVHLDVTGASNVTTIDLNVQFAAGDCSKDLLMRWGDIVEIPELDHKVNGYWGGLSGQIRNALDKCLERHVQIIVKGQTNDITLKARAAIFSSPLAPNARPPGLGPDPAKLQWSFLLNAVVHNANVILASSDLTHVKVKRLDPVTHKTTEMIFDLEKNLGTGELWLRDGDVIEIPEKS